jgi:PAS domain S-box-containing protein
MGIKRTGPIKRKASASKRVLSDKKSAKVILQKSERRSVRSESKTSAARSVAKKKKTSEFWKRADEKLRTHIIPRKDMSYGESKELILQLQTYQTELEMQKDELSKTLAELEESHSKYSALYDFAPVSYFTFDKNGLILDANLTAERDLGFKRSLLINKTFRTYIAAADRKIFDSHLRNVFKSASRQTCEIRLKRKDGIEFYARLESIAAKDLNGNSLCRSSVSDITERKKSEILLKIRYDLLEYAGTHSLEEFLQKTLDEIGVLTDSPIGFYHFVEADQKTLSLQAWSSRTVNEFCTTKGKGLHYGINEAGVWVDCVRERRPVIHNDYLSLPHRKGLPEGHAAVVRELVVPIMRGDLIVAILGIGNKSTDYTEKDVEFVSFIADVAWEITKRKRAEEALKRSEQRYRNVYDTAPVAFVLWDKETRVTDWNNRAEQMFGWTREEIVGHKFVDYIIPESVRTHVQEIVELLLEGKLPSHSINENITKDGRTIVCEWNNSILRDFVGNVEGVISLGLDITERRRAEDKLQKLTEDLERSNEDLQQFAYIASHDLQSPLRTIQGFAQLIGRRYKNRLDDNANEYIEYISEGVKDMQMLIRDLLEFSKVDSQADTSELADTSVCVNKAVSNLKAAIDEKNAEITVDKGLPVVYGNAVQLTSLLQNLIGNSIKFSRKSPRINISAKIEGNQAVFAISDNGIGMDKKDADRIFDIFRRLHNKSEYPGTGIGLAICKKIVERHGGRIWVDSQPGKGSTFYFTLTIKE